MKQNDSFRFAAVLRKVTYERRLSSQDRVPVICTIDEIFHLLADYCREMYLGVRYDDQLRQRWNTDNPDSIVGENLAVARLIHAQGFANHDLASVLDRPIPSLAAIPPDADLLETDAHDRLAAETLALLDECHGIGAANACKILHQKRPGMFPILDDLTRRALGLVWVDGEAEAYVTILQQYRESLSIGTNRTVFEAVMSHLGERGTSHLVGKPRVRVLDVLAWSLIYYRDPFRRGGPRACSAV